MCKLLLFLLVLTSISARAQLSESQIQALINSVRVGSFSQAKTANALDALNYNKSGILQPYVAAGTDTYTLTGPATITAYVNGSLIPVTFTNANATTTPTLNINSVGALGIKDNEGNDLAAGDIKAGGSYWLRYNGTHLRIVGATGGGGGGGTVTDVTGTTNRITSTGGPTPTIDISASYVGQSSISTTGTLTSGSTGAGFTISFTNSTLSGRVTEGNIPLKYIMDEATASTAGGTITLDCNNQIQRLFLGSASFATSKILALSSTTDTKIFNFAFTITNIAAAITCPSSFTSANINYNTTTDVWTPTATGTYEMGGRLIGSVWSVKIYGPLP
jgi:hypothetical protein